MAAPILGLSIPAKRDYDWPMPSKPPSGQDHTVANQFLKRNRWKPGRGRDRDSWFLPGEALPHVSLFWNSDGKPCMTYNEESTGHGLRMVWNGKRMEHFSYGVEQISKANPQSDPQGIDTEGLDFDADDEDRLKKTLQKTFVAMRSW